MPSIYMPQCSGNIFFNFYGHSMIFEGTCKFIVKLCIYIFLKTIN